MQHGGGGITGVGDNGDDLAHTGCGGAPQQFGEQPAPEATPGVLRREVDGVFDGVPVPRPGHPR